MSLENGVMILSLLMTIVGLVTSIYYAASQKRKCDKEENECRIKEQASLANQISKLASREDLDKKIETELASLKKDLNYKIEDLKSDVKSQIDDLKHDIKSQKEFTSEIKVDMVTTRESDRHAHSRIDALEKRVDDIVSMVKQKSS